MASSADRTRAMDPEALAALIRDIVAGFRAGQDALTADTRLDVIDLDSLDLVELALILEDDYGFHVPTDAFADAKIVTLGDVIAVLTTPER